LAPYYPPTHQHGAKKKNNATGGKNEIPIWDWFRAFFFFLVHGQCLFFIGGWQYPHAVSQQRLCETKLLLRDGQGKINTFPLSIKKNFFIVQHSVTSSVGQTRKNKYILHCPFYIVPHSITSSAGWTRKSKYIFYCPFSIVQHSIASSAGGQGKINTFFIAHFSLSNTASLLLQDRQGKINTFYIVH